jgi:hypothetical protein
MKVLNLRCANGHGFEGWFASGEDFMAQNGGALVECPLCGDKIITRTPSAPRLNLSGARAPDAPPPAAAGLASGVAEAPPAPATDLQASWLATVRHLLAHTEDVGVRFAEEARRIHYGETPHRAIRGQATAQDRAALQDEGIETMTIALPRALDGPVQ